MKGRKPALQGTHLFRKPPTGVYWWRRADPVTGKPWKRTTGTKVLETALRVAAEFEEEYERKKAGLTVLDNWALDLVPLAEEWLGGQRHELGPRYFPQKQRWINRALAALRLEKARDLDNVARIHDRLLALPDATRTTMRRAYQDVLKQFSAWLAANKRYLDRDPLLNWTPLKKAAPRKRRRALLPDEMARTLLALDRLDEHYGRASQRCLVVTLLVTGARVGALLSRDAGHVDARGSRIDVGPGVGKKRRGVAALDAKTLAELQAYLGDRTTGPLFLAARGGRPLPGKLLQQFKEAFSLGLVDELWPTGEERRLDLAMLVNLALLRGSLPALAGNPNFVKPETREQRGQLEARVYALAATLRPEWERRAAGVDLHGLRKTHRSWAHARGVPPVLIDKQIGHADPGDMGEVARALAGSETGRKHYLDLASELFDATRSAQAVREMLDEAVARIATTPSTCRAG